MIRFQMGPVGPNVDYQPGVQVITASRKSTRTVALNLKPTAEQGREAWTYLHTTDDDPETAIVKFEAMIPSYGCTCKSHYSKLKTDYPPDMTNSDSFWRWGWFMHNAVNEKLIAEGDSTKSIIPLDEARKIWNRPAPME